MKNISIILFVVMSLTGCAAVRRTATDENRGYISWVAFCASRGYSIDDHTFPATNEYLDTWCGSTEEEEAFIKAGVEPY